jgi:secreted trypsin-like serine protease
VLVLATYTVGGTPVQFTCTGSLVSPTVVLTAGHCAFDESTGLPLPAGVYQIGLASSTLPFPAAKARAVSAVVPYPYYNPSTGQGDAALLVMSQPAPAGATPIALASTANASLYAAGQQATVVGWGITSNAPGSAIPTNLQYGSVAVQANATCNATAVPYFPGFDLCTASAGFIPAACNGDSGGPLVVASPAGPIQIGIVSYGIPPICAAAPDFYTRASSIQSWVVAVLAGAASPPAFVPPFVATAPTASLLADGVTVSFAAPAADPATIPTGYVVTLVNSAAVAVGTQNLPVSATSATFPTLQPGAYAAVVTATYSEGASAGAISNGVALSPPSNSQIPAITGSGLVGSIVGCQTGTWVWPGTSALAIEWLRGGQPIGPTTATYTVSAADAGKMLSCRVTLIASTGPRATATSGAIFAAVKLKAQKAPSIAGVRAVGKTLCCLAGAWKHTGVLKIAYQWLRNGKAIPGRLGKSMKRRITAVDTGHKLACRVSVTTAGQAASKTTPAITVHSAL